MITEWGTLLERKPAKQIKRHAGLSFGRRHSTSFTVKDKKGEQGGSGPLGKRTVGLNPKQFV
jgi:hypothetical protein